MESQKSHGTEVEPRLNALKVKFDKLNSNDQFFQVFYKKGLTTPIQWYFIKQELEGIHKLTDFVQSKIDALYEGCEMIIRDKV